MDCCSLIDPTTQPFDALVLFTMGFTISLGHCVGMCGPLVAAFSVAQSRQQRGLGGMLGYGFVYHIGRITSYALLGVAMGLAGSAFLVGDAGRQIQGSLSLLIALIMLGLGLGLLGILPGQDWLEKLPWQNRVACHLKAALASPNLPRSYGMGFANGWLPCGPVFAAAMTAAATGSILKGALAMALFGLGTIPVLLLLTAGVGRIGVRSRTVLSRVGAILVVLIAVQLGLRGLAAWGVVSHLRFGEVVIW